MGGDTSNISQNLGISDEENAEIDAAILRGGADRTDPSFEYIYSRMIELMKERLSQGIWSEESKEEFNDVSNRFDILIKQTLWDLGYTQTEESLKENIIKRHPIADNMDNNTQRNSIIVRSLIDKIPSLEGFSLDDAVGLLKGGDSELSVRSKYKSADPDIMMAVACTMLDAKKKNLRKPTQNLQKNMKTLAQIF